MRVMGWRGLATLTVLLTVAPGCTGWSSMPVPAAPAPTRVIPGISKIGLREGKHIELRNVVIATDSLFGMSTDLSEVRYAFHLRSITAIDRKAPSAWRTLLLVGILVAVVGFSGVAGPSFR